MAMNRSTSMPAPSSKVLEKRPSLKHSVSSKGNAVTVCVRIRPPNPKEIAAEMRSCFEPSVDGDAVVEIDENYSGTPKSWPYDYVFGPESDNQHVFECTAKPLVESALEGYNTVLFMYVRKGKTFTLFGGGDVAGLVDHTLEEVYKQVMSSTDTEYVIKMTFVELYNEELKDLLSDDRNAKLNIIEDAVLGPLIQNITEVNFTNVDRMRRCLDEGDQRRHFGVTNMNAHSSRSHVMVRLSIESRKTATKPTEPLRQSWGKDKPTCFSTLNLVDLAGSERANKSGTSGQSLKEGSYINKSLLTLGTVISGLSEGSTKHIPYRDSKLTRLLASALGGNAKTCMITCVSPASGNIGESHSTLRFASRAKRIVNHVRKNEFDDAKSLAQKLAQKESELESLRAEMDAGNFGGAGALREKALMAQRKFRGLKFLMKNSAQIMKSLNKLGKVELAKQVRDDVRGVLDGSRALDDVLEEHSDIMSRHLGTSEQLMRRVSILNRVNSLDLMDDDTEDESFAFEEEEEYFDDFQNDEHAEELERSKMAYEDMIVLYESKLDKFNKEHKEMVQLEKKYRQKSEDLEVKLSDANEELNMTRESMADLKGKYDRLNKKSAEDIKSSRTECENITKHVNNLEDLLNEKEKTIEDMLAEIAAKNEEKGELHALNDTLQKQLQTANTLRMNFENEAKRTKDEMRAQMERLRSTMSNVLQQGEGESKVLEMQNAMLFSDLKTAQDEVASVKALKAQVDDEMQSLRKELGNLQLEMKAAMLETRDLRSQLAKSQQTERLHTIELTKLQSKFEVSELDGQKLRERLQEEEGLAAAEINKLKTQWKSDTATLKDQIEKLETEITILKANIAHEREALEAKEVAFAKLEQQSHFENLKLEKKMADQLRSHDEMSLEHANIQRGLKERITQLLDQKVKLNDRITSQEIWIASVNKFLENNDLDNYDGDIERVYYDCPDDVSDRSTLCTSRQVSFSFDGYSDLDDSVKDEDDESWIPAHSPVPPSSITKLFSPTKKNVVSKPAIASTPDLSRVTQLAEESSTRFKMIKLGLQTATMAMEYVLQNELVCHKNQINVASTINHRLEFKTSECLKKSGELEAVIDLKERIRHNLIESQDREMQLQNRVADLEAKLREAHSAESTLHSSEDAMRARYVQMEYDRASSRTQLVKAKSDLQELREEISRLESANEQLARQLHAKTEENILLGSDLDLLEQRMTVVLAERDELVVQFVKGGHYAVDENGLESLYSSN